MGECEARTQGALIAALWGRLRTTHRAAQRGQSARASFRDELSNSRIDPTVEVSAEPCSRSVDEVEEELTVSFRAGQPRVYDAGGLCIPVESRFRNVPQHSRARLVRRDHAAAADGLWSRLELG